MKYLFVGFLLVFFTKVSYCQLDRITAIGAYTYNFAKTIEWDNEDDFNEFNILLISNDQEIIVEFQKFTTQKTIKDKKINLTVSQIFDESSKPRLIFISKEFENISQNVYTEIQGSKILLVTENFEDKRFLMINLFETIDSIMLFEINKANILIQGLIILPDLVMMGGEEIDIAKLYLNAVNNLIQTENKLDSIRNIEKTLAQQIISSNLELIGKEKKLSESELKIAEQEIVLSGRQKQLDSIYLILNYIENVYDKLKDSISGFDKIYKLKLEMLSEKEAEINENLKIIVDQEILIEQQKKEIVNQDISLITQSKQIELQRRTVILLLITVLLILAGIIFSINAAIRKQKMNRLLKEQKNKLNDSLIKLQITKDQLFVAKTEADKANMAKTEFISNMSHELRTPLNAIIGFSHHLQNKPNLTYKQKDQIGTIYKSGEHLLTMINDILDFGKLETGNADVSQKEITDLDIVISQTFNIIKIGADEKDLKLVLEKDKDLPQFIMINQRIFKQIILNILSNAVKYTNEGFVYYRMKYDNISKHLIFEVEDTGIGISKENFDRIFMPFTRVESSAYQAKGTGLGLSIVKQQINNLNGKIELTSEIGKGSKFTVYLPVDNAVNQSANKVSANEEFISGYHGETKKILVVDNNFSNCSLMADILEEIRFSVFKAENGKIGLNMLKGNKFDLVLLDLAMPVLNGLEAAKIIRKEYPSVKIIGVSAFSHEKEILDKFIAECDFFLTKPIDNQILLDTIKQLLNLTWIYNATNEENQIEKIEKNSSLVPDKEIIIEMLNNLKLGDYDSIEEKVNLLEKDNPEFTVFKQKIYTFITNFEESKLEKYLKSIIDDDKL